MILLLGVLFIGHAPLVPLQILWINLVTGAIMAIPLGMEPRVGDELDYPPRSSRVGLLYTGMLLRIVFMSVMLAVGSLMVFIWAYGMYGLHEARTLTFCAIVMFEWLIAFNARSDQHTIFKLGLFKNRLLFAAVLIAITLQVTLIYTPFLHEPFDIVPLEAWEWGVALMPGMAIFLIETTRKLIFPKLFHKGKLS
jgi:Ca2+-transporting ATPase